MCSELEFKEPQITNFPGIEELKKAGLGKKFPSNLFGKKGLNLARAKKKGS